MRARRASPSGAFLPPTVIDEGGGEFLKIWLAGTQGKVGGKGEGEERARDYCTTGPAPACNMSQIGDAFPPVAAAVCPLPFRPRPSSSVSPWRPPRHYVSATSSTARRSKISPRRCVSSRLVCRTLGGFFSAPAGGACFKILIPGRRPGATLEDPVGLPLLLPVLYALLYSNLPPAFLVGTPVSSQAVSAAARTHSRLGSIGGVPAAKCILFCSAPVRSVLHPQSFSLSLRGSSSHLFQTLLYPVSIR